MAETISRGEDGALTITIGRDTYPIRPKTTEELARDFNVTILERAPVYGLRPPAGDPDPQPLSFAFRTGANHAAHVAVAFPAMLLPFPQMLRRHSSGYSYGYEGSGPADLALNILYYLTGGDLWFACCAHQDFKRAFVGSARLKFGQPGEVPVAEMDAWIAAARARYDAAGPDGRFEWYEIIWPEDADGETTLASLHTEAEADHAGHADLG